MPTIAIQATDTLFFRDGRPFSMGDDSFAQGVFPPPPSVLYGALRSAYISKGLEDDLHLNELIKESENLRFNFIGLQVGSSPYFPLPMDLIVPKPIGKAPLKTKPLKLVDAPKFSNAQTSKILKPEHDGKTEDDTFLIELLAFENYLEGTSDQLNVKKRSDFLTSEPKIGIGRDRDSNIADGGKLFRIQANRLSKIDSRGNLMQLRFLLDLEGLDVPKNGWMTLGGERKVAIFEKMESIEIIRPNIETSRFKIYIATPAVFEAGWKPEKLLQKHGLTLLAAAIDRPLSIGGWDLEKNKPKPMVQCVPAGAVYYVEASSTAAAVAIAQEIHGKSIAENFNHTDYQKQGFGIAYVGKILESS